jgi:hypothetical protein
MRPWGVDHAMMARKARPTVYPFYPFYAWWFVSRLGKVERSVPVSRPCLSDVPWARTLTVEELVTNFPA